MDNNILKALGKNTMLLFGAGAFAIIFAAAFVHSDEQELSPVQAAVEPPTSCRVCIQLADDLFSAGFGLCGDERAHVSANGAEECTPWTAEGEEWSGFANDSDDGANPNCMRMRLECR